jgi:hypothetical protein
MEVSHFIGTENRIQIYPSEKFLSNKIRSSEFHLKNENIDLIPYSEEINEETFISLVGIQEHNDIKQGIYQLLNENFNSNIALNYPRNESDIKTLKEDEISELFQGVKSNHLIYKSIENGSETLKVDLEKPQEYWRIFLILTLLFVLIEMSLTRFMK